MSIRESILAILDDGPSHGFALKKTFEDRTGGIWPVNVGQIYTTLKRLARDGCVEDMGTGDDGQRDYQITDAGRSELADWFSTPRERDVPDRDELVIKIAMAIARKDAGAMSDHRLVDPLTVIDEQRQLTMAALQAHTRTRARLDPADLPARISHNAAASSIEAELRWLDQCEELLILRQGTEQSEFKSNVGGESHEGT